MKRLVLSAAVAVIILNAVDFATAAELPTYELTGFPITALQSSVLGSAHVEEASPLPVLTLGGMPASPHQIAVLTPRRKIIGELTGHPTGVGPEVTR